MAKKYLLYIHYDQFDVEEKKSNLINDLLGTYYKQPFTFKPRAIKKKPRKTNDLTPVLTKLNGDSCTHGAGKGFCKFASCSNSMFDPRNRRF